MSIQSVLFAAESRKKGLQGKVYDRIEKLHDDEKLQYFHAEQKYRNSYEWKDLHFFFYHTTYLLLFTSGQYADWACL